MPRLHTTGSLLLVSCLGLGASARAFAAEPTSAASPPADDTAERDSEPAASDETRVVTVKTTSGDGLTATSHRVDSATIRTTPKRSAEDLLRLVPGMLVVQHGNQGKGQQYYIRGFDAAHGADLELLVDDIPMNERSNVHAHGYLDLSFVIPEVVQELEVKKGSARLEQGAFATAGTVEYRLGVPGPLRGTRVGYELGSTGRHRAVVVHAPKDRGDETFVAVSAFTDKGYGENREAQGLSTLGKARLWQGRGAWVDATGGVYAARFGLPGTLRLDDYKTGRVGFYDAYLHDTGGESSRALASVKAGVERDELGMSITTHAQVRRLSLDENFTGYSGTEAEFGEGDERAAYGDRNVQSQDAGIGGVRLHGWWQAHPKLGLRLEGHWTGTVLDQRIDRVTTAGQRWDVSHDQLVQQHELGLGPGLRWRTTPWLRMEAGVRVEAVHSQVRDRLQADQVFSGTQVAAAPRFAAQALLGPRWQLFSSYGRGFRPPEARAHTLPTEVPEDVELDRFRGGEPRMTLADSAELGARWQPADFMDFGAAVFGTWIGRESVFDHVSGFNIERGASRRLGVEADVQVRPTPWMGLGLSIVGNHARFSETGAFIPGAPPLLAQVQGTLMHPKGWRAGLRWFAMGRRPLSYGATAGAVTVVDASVGYQWKWFGVDLSVDNLIGTRWRDGEYHFASYWDRNQTASRLPTIHYVAGPPRMVRLAGTIDF